VIFISSYKSFQSGEIMRQFAVEPNSLPVIIDEPGMYKCRNGQLVTIHEVKEMEGHKPEYTSFPAKGSRWTKKVGQSNPPYGIWHVSGRYMPLTESKFDIVKKA